MFSVITRFLRSVISCWAAEDCRILANDPADQLRKAGSLSVLAVDASERVFFFSFVDADLAVDDDDSLPARGRDCKQRHVSETVRGKRQG